MPENRGSCTYSFNKSFVCLFKFSGGWGNPQGSKKNVQDFCRTLVIVKSSELTRTRREGGKRNGSGGGEGLPWVVVLAMKSRSQGPTGRKVQNQARKMDKENQGREVGDGEGRRGAGHRALC